MQKLKYVNNRKSISINAYEAGEVYLFNKGFRHKLNPTKAVLDNSIFRDFLLHHHLKVKNDHTDDLISMSFNFGQPDFQTELKRTKHVEELLEHESEWKKTTKEEIRRIFYEDGVIINNVKYKYLYRSSGQAKVGKCIFIREELYQKSIDYLSMNLWSKMKPNEPAKIVELSAYMPLICSSIEDRLYISVDDILVLQDVETTIQQMCNVIELNEDKTGRVEQKEVDITNTLFDGQSIIESSIVPPQHKGFVLLRQHFFKSCCFKGHIQKFFKDYCINHNLDYETYQVEDMFGKMHYVKDIKLITTNNSLKWLKFKDMGMNWYNWKRKIEKEGCLFGIVKSAHESKYGVKQRVSYQMLNSLPLNKKDVYSILQYDLNYIDRLKNDIEFFKQYLLKKKNEINHYQMLYDLIETNPQIVFSDWFKIERKDVIMQYVNEIKKGKVRVDGDNCTVVGNPLAMLYYAISGEVKDPCFTEGENECYTSRFEDEYICSFRSPHNAPNNVNYLHNVPNELFDKYFDFSPNVIAVNLIKTDLQARMNGLDQDSDAMLCTNNKIMVECAKKCRNGYFTILNNIPLQGSMDYNFCMKDFSLMDSKMQNSSLAIGLSSNLAQICLSYYWSCNEAEKQKYEFLFCELSVIAQLAIDSAKRLYLMNTGEELKMLQAMIPKQKPLFFSEILEFSGKQAKKQFLSEKVNYSIKCPMNYLEQILTDNVKMATKSCTIDIMNCFNRNYSSEICNNHQIEKIHNIIEDFDKCVKKWKITTDEETFKKLLRLKDEQITKELHKIKLSNDKTMNKAIERVFERNEYKKLQRKLLKALYNLNATSFLKNFQKDVRPLLTINTKH